MKLKPVEDQVVVVMGASSGIGREAAKRFAARGAKVVVSARGTEGLESLVREISGSGGTAIAVAADVTDAAAVRDVAERAVAEYGRLDTWVHLAGIGLWATFDDTTVEEFRRVIDVNLIGQIHGAKAALPHIRRTGRGALASVSSIEARRSLPLHTAYGASKHGVDGFLEALRVELRHDGVPIAVTQVLPGTIDTPIFDKARTRVGFKPRGAPPVYAPGTVVEMLLHAAEFGGRDLFAGGAARFVALQQNVSRRALDAALATPVAWRSLITREPKPETARDNLFEPVSGHDTVRDGFRALRHSVSDWIVRRGRRARLPLS